MSFMKGKVCDLGCGPAVMYEGKEVDLTGVDWSPEGLEQARLHCPNGKYVCSQVTDTGLPSSEFDTVIMCGLLDYFDDWTPVINEAKRILKPNGKIIATLLYGFQGHLWTEELAKSKHSVLSFKHITSNWYLVEIDTSN